MARNTDLRGINYDKFLYKFLYILSSSELVIIYCMVILTIYYQNIYTAGVLLLLMNKSAIFGILKKQFIKYNIGKRPKKAFNCNFFNCGGKSISGGMPSGHMGFMGIIIGIIYNMYKLNNNKTYIYVYLLMVILTGISRYLLKCHTLLQIIMGYVIGILLGYMYYVMDDYLDKNIDYYRYNRSIFYNHFK
jgi:membrane-associated phospholipid phosphatase